MAVQVIDARGLKCPQPQLKMMSASHSMAKGDILEVIADCDTFENDVRAWCQRARKALLWIRSEGAAMRCQVQI
ncbi:MAG: sulfurtransferase TusA family protein [Acidobacteria bacterium]|nr:sulfurtransferase TusA family protein [Acidobacteriota bacterium]